MNDYKSNKSFCVKCTDIIYIYRNKVLLKDGSLYYVFGVHVAYTQRTKQALLVSELERRKTNQFLL